MKEGSLLLFLLLVVLCVGGATSWNPDAGLADNYALTATFTVSSGNASSASNIPNYNTNDGWSSGFCGPSGWLIRQDLNVAFNVCALYPSACTSSSNSAGLNGITDTTFQTMYNVKPDGTGTSKISITFPQPTPVVQIDIRAVINTQATITLTPTDGSAAYVISLNSSINWVAKFLPVNSQQVFSSLTISSQDAQGFGLFGIAVQNETCNEWVIVDLGSNQQVSWIGLRAVLATPNTVIISTSPDGPYNWEQFTFIAKSLWGYTDFQAPVRTARYIKVWFNISQSWESAQFLALKVFDQNGPYGAPYPLSRPNTRSYSDLLGLNIIWGWGMDYEYANHSYAGNGGPAFYRPIASYVRQYHDLGWDINSPTAIINWTAMSEGKGTQSIPWVNWDICYESIHLRNYTFVDVSIQFLNNNGTNLTEFSQPKWPNPYQNAYTYGLGFAQHFGPSNLNLIQSAEIGNEPWDYDADFFLQVLLGMAKGIKDGDSKIQVLPGAFQANSPDYPPNGDNIFYNAKYYGYRVSPEALTLLDHLNTHAYSWATINLTTIGIMPEHPQSTFKAFRNVLRWRDANCPDKEMWMTEWGWDAAEQCHDTRCVTLEAQAAYGVRGLLMGAREGNDRMTWYWFYDSGWGLFGKSGVSIMQNETYFTHKPVFYSFLNLLTLFGNHHHYAALAEGPDAFVYLLTDGSQTFTHMVAWAIVSGDDGNEYTYGFSYSGATLAANEMAVEIGMNSNGSTPLPATTFQTQGGNWKVILSRFPRAVAVTPVSSLQTTPQHLLFSWGSRVSAYHVSNSIPVV